MKQIGIFFKNQKLLCALIILFIFSAIAIPTFLTEKNIINFFIQIAVEGIMLCGTVFVIINGDFDISIGSILTLTSLVTVFIVNATGSIFLALLACAAIGVAIGLFHGFFVAKMNVHSFIVTLAGMLIYRGIAFLISDGKSFICKNEFFVEISKATPLFLPNLVWIFFGLIIFMEVILKKTRFGRNMYAAGGNREVAKNSGINVDFQRISAFVLSALTASFGGFLLASRMETGTPNYGTDSAMTVISAIVLGGTSLSGGRGGAMKALIGLLIVGLLTNMLNMMNVFSYYQYAVKGLLVIVIVASDRFYYNRMLKVSA